MCSFISNSLASLYILAFANNISSCLIPPFVKMQWWCVPIVGAYACWCDYSTGIILQHIFFLCRTLGSKFSMKNWRNLLHSPDHQVAPTLLHEGSSASEFVFCNCTLIPLHCSTVCLSFACCSIISRDKNAKTEDTKPYMWRCVKTEEVCLVKWNHLVLQKSWDAYV